MHEGASVLAPLCSDVNAVGGGRSIWEGEVTEEYRYRHWVSSSSVVTLNLQANAQLTVIAGTPHTMARPVQSQATSDHFLSQNARMFQLESFDNTVLHL